MWRRVAFLLTLFVLAGYAYQPLWGAGPIGSDLLTLLDAGEVAWPTERGDGTFEPLDLYSVHGVDERPLAACVLAVESRLLTLGGRLTGAEVNVLRLMQLALLLVGAWGLARFVRRALLPWSGSEGARTAGYASAMVLALHPLAVSVVARPASVGDLLGLALATWGATAFLRGRQDREHSLVVLACAMTVLCGALTELAYLLALVLGLVELTSARRYRPLHVRLRTAGTTLAVFGAAAAVELGVRVALGAPVSAPGLVGVWLEDGAGSSLGQGLAVAVEKLGLLIMPVHPSGGLGPLGFLVAAVALLLSLEPALVAARSAPRLWGWLLGIWCVAIVIVQLSTTTQRVPPETLAGVETLFPAVLVMAVALGVTATALSGTRRTAMPLIAGVCYAILAHGASQPYGPAGEELARLRADLDQAREVHGRDAHFFVLDPPGPVKGLETVGEALGRLLDPALTGEPETPTVEGMSEAAFTMFARQPEFDQLREGRLVLVYPARLLEDVVAFREEQLPARDGTREDADPRRLSVRFPPGSPAASTFLWRAEPSTVLIDLDPLRYTAVRITAEPKMPTDSAPWISWRSTASTGQRSGAWLEGTDGPVGFIDLSRSLAWLVGGTTRRVWVEDELAMQIVSGEILPELPELLGLERRRDGEDWRFELVEEGLPTPLDADPAASDTRQGRIVSDAQAPGTVVAGAPQEPPAGLGWSLSLMDISTYTYVELPVLEEGQGRLVAPGAATWQDRVLRGGGGPIAWSLERRLGRVGLASASGRVDS